MITIENAGSARRRQGTDAVHRSPMLFSRDINYLRDVALFWPFAFSLLWAPWSLLSPSHRQIGLTFAAIAIGSFILMREKAVVFFVALGFLALQGVLDLIVGQRSWAVVGVVVLTGVPFLIANRYWRNPKLSYKLPEEYGAVDMLLSFASMCAFILQFALALWLEGKLFPLL